MKTVAIGAFTLLLASVAGCSSSSSSSSSSGNSCKPGPGTYKSHYTKESSSTGACADVPDSTITITGNEDGGTGQPVQPGCTENSDKLACTSTVSCKTTTSGITVETNITTKLTAEGGSGTLATKTSGGPDAANSDCKYSFTFTKQ